MNFGIIVKRKTLLKGFIVVLACLFLGYVWRQNSSFGIASESQLPELDLTWDRFIRDCAGGATNQKASYHFEQIYKGKVVKW